MGRQTIRRLYGKTTDRLIENLRNLHEQVPSIVVRDAYGRIIARKGMSLREREIVNVVVLSIQNLNRQLYSHLRGAMRVGVTRVALHDAILLASRATGMNPRTPLEMLASLTASRRRRQ